MSTEGGEEEKVTGMDKKDILPTQDDSWANRKREKGKEIK